MCLHSSLAKNLLEKKGIKPVTSDKDQMFDFKQKKANTSLWTPLTPWVLYLNCWTELERSTAYKEMHCFLLSHLAAEFPWENVS